MNIMDNIPVTESQVSAHLSIHKSVKAKKRLGSLAERSPKSEQERVLALKTESHMRRN